MSAPPPPSIVSLPEPPVMMLSADEPVIESAVDRPDALTFWKLLTVVASPESIKREIVIRSRLATARSEKMRRICHFVETNLQKPESNV